MDSIAIGRYISSLRKEKGFTQQQLADKLGITNKAISKWETGEGLPDISILPALSEVLGVKIDDILNGAPTFIDDSNPTMNKFDITDNQNDQYENYDSIKNEENSNNQVLKYIADKKQLLYHRQRIISFAIGITGILLMLSIQKIIWNDQYLTELAVGIGLIFQLVSIVLFEISHISYKSELISYNNKMPVESIKIYSKLQFYIKAIWIYLFIPIWYTVNVYNKMIFGTLLFQLTNKFFYHSPKYNYLTNAVDSTISFSFLYLYGLVCTFITVCIFIIMMLKKHNYKNK